VHKSAVAWEKMDLARQTKKKKGGRSNYWGSCQWYVELKSRSTGAMTTGGKVGFLRKKGRFCLEVFGTAFVKPEGVP